MSGWGGEATDLIPEVYGGVRKRLRISRHRLKKRGSVRLASGVGTIFMSAAAEFWGLGTRRRNSTPVVAQGNCEFLPHGTPANDSTHMGSTKFEPEIPGRVSLFGSNASPWGLPLHVCCFVRHKTSLEAEMRRLEPKHVMGFALTSSSAGQQPGSPAHVMGSAATHGTGYTDRRFSVSCRGSVNKLCAGNMGWNPASIQRMGGCCR